jgi:hypothetical protein
MGDVEPTGERLDRVERDVGDRKLRRRQRPVAGVDQACLDRDVVARHIDTSRRDGRFVDVDSGDRRMPELRRRHGEYPRAAADVEQAAPLFPEQQLEAEASRRMGAGTERPPGIDNDGQSVARRLLPRWPDPKRPDPSRAVKRAPAVLPARFDLARPRSRELGEDAHRRITVGGELDLGPMLLFLDSRGCQLDEARPEQLELLAAGANCGTDQRNALRSLRMKPSSVSS